VRMFRLGRRAVSALEFALVAPLLLLLMLAANDFGNALQQATRLETAARAGAQFALAFPTDQARIVQATRDGLQTAWQAGTAVTVQCRCGTTAQACSAACTGEFRVTITTRRAFEPLFFFLLPDEVAGNATVRIR
jgi:Flp pilus assembly protein TadG